MLKCSRIQPASTVTVAETGSIDIIWFKRSNDKIISLLKPTCPPTKPVFPPTTNQIYKTIVRFNNRILHLENLPWVTTATRSLLQYINSLEMSLTEFGFTTKQPPEYCWVQSVVYFCMSSENMHPGLSILVRFVAWENLIFRNLVVTLYALIPVSNNIFAVNYCIVLKIKAFQLRNHILHIASCFGT